MKIYTADFGSYDNHWEGADVRFSEDNDPQGMDWLTPKMRAKRYKMDVMFPKAIWIDASIEVLDRPALEKAMRIGVYELVLLPHPARYEIASEFRVVRQSNLDEPAAIDRATRLYHGDPNYRAYCGGVFAYRDTEAVRRFMGLWWALVKTTSVRDQLSLPFALSVSQVKYRVADIDLWDNELFKVHGHKQ